MHPAFIYVVHPGASRSERRRMSSHLPDPDPSEESAPRPIVAAPQRSRPDRRGRRLAGAVVAASRRRLSRAAGGSGRA